MVRPQLVATSGGVVEVLHVPGERPPVLFFPGGHSRAETDCGLSLYTDLGHEVVSFSRPSYGRTRVGRLSAAEFAPLVGEVCAQLRISSVAAVVGVSFGGLQAVHVAAAQRPAARRLVLHSCAPSTLPYPDRRAETVLGPVVFSPLLQGLVWWAIRRAVGWDAGLRAMMAPLSNLPVDQWWKAMSPADRDTARALFRSMRSDSGFSNDLRQGRRADAGVRCDALSRVPCPTLVTAPGATGACPSHTRWISPASSRAPGSWSSTPRPTCSGSGRSGHDS